MADTAEIEASELDDIADELPARVLAAFKGNMAQENAQRITRGEPTLRPMTVREEGALQMGAQLAATLFIASLEDVAERHYEAEEAGGPEVTE